MHGRVTECRSLCAVWVSGGCCAARIQTSISKWRVVLQKRPIESLVCQGLISFGSKTGCWQHRPRVRWLGVGRCGGLHVLAWAAGMVGAFVTLGSEQITCRAPAVTLIGVAPGPAAGPSVLHCGEGGCCGQPRARGWVFFLLAAAAGF